MTEQATRRPVGAQLAVITERAVEFPAEAAERVVFHELPAVVYGARELVRDWHWWRSNGARQAEIDEAKAMAMRQGLVPARLATDREHAAKEASKRAIISWAAFGGLILLLTACSVAGFWSWHSWRWWGPVGMVALLAASRYYRQKWLARLSWIPLPVVTALGIDGWRWWPWWIAAGLFVLACEQRGLRMAMQGPRAPGYQPGDSPSWARLWRTAQEVLERRGKVVTRGDTTAPISSDGQESGVVFTLRCTEPILGDDVRSLERELGFPTGASAWVPDPRAAGSGELRLCWLDPLPPRIAPRREPMSLSYASRIEVASREGGRTTALGLARMRIVLAGNSGSGKSQALQNLLDAVCDMPDADWSGIDVQEGPTLKAYQAQWNCRSVHYTRAAALEHVKALRELCVARNRRLDEGMDADLDGEIDQWWIVGEEPDRRGHVLFIDELSSFTADKECREELILLLEVCRKASVSVVMATPDLETTRVPAAVRDQAGVKVAFGCPFPDAQLMFGKGSTQSGWEPWSFVPADDASPNDAGKSYVLGAGYNRPEVHRWFALPKDEIVARNRARRLWRGRFAPPIETPDAVVLDVVDAVEVPEPLATLERLTVDGDVHTSRVLAALDGWTARAVGEALRPHGVASANVVVDGVQAKGYRADQVKRAVQALDGTA